MNNPRQRKWSEGFVALATLSSLALQCGDFAADAELPSAGGAAGESAAGANGGDPNDSRGGAPLGGDGGRDSPGGRTGEGGTPSEGGSPGTPLELRPERSVLVSDRNVLANFRFERVLRRIAGDAGTPMYEAFTRSFIPREPDNTTPEPRCDDERADDGTPTLNGYPIPCPAEAADLIGVNPAVWKPLAAVNRFDLAPVGGENCGEQHLNFYFDRRGSGLNPYPLQAFLRVSAVIANPSPELGLAGCRPLVDFWASLSRPEYDSPAARGQALETAFLSASVVPNAPFTAELQALASAGFKPFMSPEHFGHLGRIQLLYLGDKGLWHYFEHALVPDEPGFVRRRPLTQNLAVAELLSSDPNFSTCATELLRSIPGLLTEDPARLRLDVDPSCFDGTASSDDPTLSTGIGGAAAELGYEHELRLDVQDTLDTLYPSYELSDWNILGRASFAGTCHGCHDVSPSPYATPGSVAHVNNLRSEPCSEGEDERNCYARSPLLKFEYLPHWTDVLQNFWEHPDMFPPLRAGEHSMFAVDGTILVRQNP